MGQVSTTVRRSPVHIPESFLWWRDLFLAVVIAGLAAMLLTIVGVLDTNETAVPDTRGESESSDVAAGSFQNGEYVGPMSDKGKVSAFGDADGAGGHRFTADMVAVTAQGQGTIQAYFVAEASAAKINKLAKQCVNSYFGEGYDAVNCYGFASQEALEFAAPSDVFGEGMEHPCWTAFSSDSVDSGTAGTATNPAYKSEGCP